MPEHRRAAGQHAGEVVDEDRREQCGNEPLGGVEDHHRHAELRPERPPDVGRADVPAPEPADVDAAEGADEPVAGRNAAGQVAGDYEKNDAQVVIWYRVTQSLIASQSRLSKNASM